ncbi:MAG: hypothetical protein AAGD01_08150 [Acidobacteriota bacterium]
MALAVLAMLACAGLAPMAWADGETADNEIPPVPRVTGPAIQADTGPQGVGVGIDPAGLNDGEKSDNEIPPLLIELYLEAQWAEAEIGVGLDPNG